MRTGINPQSHPADCCISYLKLAVGIQNSLNTSFEELPETQNANG